MKRTEALIYRLGVGNCADTKTAALVLFAAQACRRMVTVRVADDFKEIHVFAVVPLPEEEVRAELKVGK